MTKRSDNWAPATKLVRAGTMRSEFGETSEAMFLAVRFGGGPCSGLPWRWGFGYLGCTIFGPTARE